MNDVVSQTAIHWTTDRVAERLIWALSMMPHHAVFTARGQLRQIETNAAAAVLGWPLLFVGDPRSRLALIGWVRCRASGGSVRALYRDLGWCRAKAERQRRDALAMIALGLNENLTMRPTAEEP